MGPIFTSFASLIGLFLIANTIRAFIKGKGYLHALFIGWGEGVVREAFKGNLMGLVCFRVTQACVIVTPLLLGHLVFWPIFYPLEALFSGEVRLTFVGICAALAWIGFAIWITTLAKSYEIPQTMEELYPAQILRNLVSSRGV